MKYMNISTNVYKDGSFVLLDLLLLLKLPKLWFPFLFLLNVGQLSFYKKTKIKEKRQGMASYQ